MTRFLSIIISLLYCSLVCSAQIDKPVKWSTDIKMTDDTAGYVIVKAEIENGWHIYALSLPDGGPNPTVIAFDESDCIKFTGNPIPSRQPESIVDMVFHLELDTWDNSVTFSQHFTVDSPGNHNINGRISYMACNNSACTMPETEEFSITFKTVGIKTPGQLTDNTDKEILSPGDNSLSQPGDSENSTIPTTKSPYGWIYLILFLLLAALSISLFGAFDIKLPTRQPIPADNNISDNTNKQQPVYRFNSVKVVSGFLALALSLRFLSVADIAYEWGILDREVFLSLWITIFALLGIYLLGKIRFPHDPDITHLSVTRFMLALFSLSFAIYLVPGLWGAPLEIVSTFLPPAGTQDFMLYIN